MDFEGEFTHLFVNTTLKIKIKINILHIVIEFIIFVFEVKH